jgi:hypothetical protein
MTITRRDLNVLDSPTRIPTRAANLIDNAGGEVDDNVLAIFKALMADIEDYKASMFGITRRYGRFDQMMYLYNNPTGKEGDIEEAARMDKNGSIAIGTEYPRWPRCKVDVNGPLYAIPQFGLWAKTTVDAAGAGLYTWDTEVSNPNSDIYTRTAGNTRIRISEPGTYEIKANIFVQDGAAATGDGFTMQVRQNAVVLVGAVNGLTSTDLVWFHMTGITNASRGDLVDVNFAGPATGAKFGNNVLGNTWLSICKVN